MINPNEDVNVLKDKVDILEKMVKELTEKVEIHNLEQMEKILQALTRKVLSQEKEIEVMKNNIKINKNKVNKNCLQKERSFNISDIKHSSSTPKVLKEKGETEGGEEDLFNCKECNYKCKKEQSLKKHMITKHESHKCKECKEELFTFMELLQHVAKDHSKDKEEKEIKYPGEKDVENKHTQNENKVIKESVFVFKGSKLDK